jgi:hypothetical protein
MYERFTDRARQVMKLASEIARGFMHEYIGTEHILLAMIEENSGVAAAVLKNLNIDSRRVTREVKSIVIAGNREPTTANLPLTPRAKKVIEYAIDEARKLGHNYVGSEHLLLGLIREEDGVAAQVLKNLGLSLHAARNEVLTLLGAGHLHSKTEVILPPPIEEPEPFKVATTKVLGDLGPDFASAMGPAFLDSYIRQAIQMCWMGLPQERRTVAEVETQIRRLVDRALQNLREDAAAFGLENLPKP